MESVIQVQILDNAVCISSHANTLEKGMNPSILLPGKLGSLALVSQLV